MPHIEEKKKRIQELFKENTTPKTNINSKSENPNVQINGNVHFSSRDIHITYVCKKDDSCDKK